MKCCTVPGCRAFENTFDVAYAEKDLAAYRKHGPAKATRLLLQAIRSHVDVRGATLLDIGGGVGVIQHELFAAGLGQAVDVDAASAFLAAARREAERRGFADRVMYLHGDFVPLAEAVAPADVVTLDRVICCYADMPGLVGAAAVRARRVLGLVFPRDTWWMRIGAWVVNLFERFQPDPLSFHVHAAEAVDAVAAQHGLALGFHRNAGLWQVRLYVPDQRADAFVQAGAGGM
jgi:magnesium-protoporphyrin O-methyltransferase